MTRSVSSEEVRNFRGFLDHKADHGVFFTTSRFTTEAMNEAVALCKTLIRMVPLDQLITMLHVLGLGVVSDPEPKVVPAFFDQYRKMITCLVT